MEDSIKKFSFKRELWEWFKAAIIALAIVSLVRWLLVSPCIVEGVSMEPSFVSRERVVVNKILYRLRDPHAGEVVVFYVPEEDRDLIKRVIAVAGDTVKVEGDNVYVNGKKIREDYLKQAIAEKHAQGMLYNNLNFEEATVPEGTVFVMGDNRSNSKDSRELGFIGLDQISGRPDIVFWPPANIRLVSK